jgi:hypothetical protein
VCICTWQTLRLITGWGTCSLCLPANVTNFVTQSLSIRYPNNWMLYKVQHVLVKCDVDTAVQRKDLLPTLERTWLLLNYGFHACRATQLILMYSTSKIKMKLRRYLCKPYFVLLSFVIIFSYMNLKWLSICVCECVCVCIMHWGCTSRRESHHSIYRSSSLCSLLKSSSD